MRFLDNKIKKGEIHAEDVLNFANLKINDENEIRRYGVNWYSSNSVLSSMIPLVINSFYNDDFGFEVINRYINNYLNLNDNYENYIIFLKKLEEKLFEFNYIPPMAVLESLIKKNTNIRKITELIFEQNKNGILSGNLLSIFDSYFIIILIEAYCNTKNIKITSNLNLQLLLSIYPNLGEEEKLQMESLLSNCFPLNEDEMKMIMKNMKSEDVLEQKQAQKELIDAFHLLVDCLAKVFYLKYKPSFFTFNQSIEITKNLLNKAIDEYDYKKGYNIFSFIIFAIINDFQYEIERLHHSFYRIVTPEEREKWFAARRGIRIQEGGVSRIYQKNR